MIDGVATYGDRVYREWSIQIRGIPFSAFFLIHRPVLTQKLLQHH